MSNILLTFHTVAGHTRRICDALQAELAGMGRRADVAPIASGIAHPARYDQVVIGASIRYGKQNPVVLALTRWKPQLVGVFGGIRDYQSHGAIDRTIIGSIMWLTDGPTNLQVKVEYTDWDEVRRYAGRIAALVEGATAQIANSWHFA